ncbi:MAG: divalent-cation tolerance protein CutA [Gemmatimonadales bacterium]
MTGEIVEVKVTAPDRAVAERLAEALVAERLAACVQVGGPIYSVYRWRGTIERAEEWTCRVKTTRERLPALESRVRALHPHELPEILALPAGSTADYAAWVRDGVGLEGGA